MSTSPRIVFSTFASPSDPMLAAWRRFRDSVARPDTPTARRLPARIAASVQQAEPGTPIRQAETDAPVTMPAADERTTAEILADEALAAARTQPVGVWRVLASNNRELARSAEGYPTFDEARAHAVRIREHVNELDIVLVTGARPDSHGWYFALDDAAVLTCGRWYGAPAVGLEAALATLDALRSGTVADVPHEISPSRRVPRLR